MLFPRSTGLLPVKHLPALSNHLSQKGRQCLGLAPSYRADGLFAGLFPQPPHLRTVGMLGVSLPPGFYRQISRLVGILLHPFPKKMVDPAEHRPLGPEVLDQGYRIPAQRLPQLLHLLHVSSSEPVDGLLGVPDHEKLSGYGPYLPPVPGPGGIRSTDLFGQKHGYFGLQGVCVLGFINQQVGVLVPVVIPYLQVVPKQAPGPDQQVLKAGSSLLFSFHGPVQKEFPQGAQQGH